MASETSCEASASLSGGTVLEVMASNCDLRNWATVAVCVSSVKHGKGQLAHSQPCEGFLGLSLPIDAALRRNMMFSENESKVRWRGVLEKLTQSWHSVTKAMLDSDMILK